MDKYSIKLDSLWDQVESSKSYSESKAVYTEMQILQNCAQAELETGIKAANKAEADAKVELVKAQTEKEKALTKTAKVEAVSKIINSVVPVAVAAISTTAVVCINGMQLAAADRRETRLDGDLESAQKTLGTSLLNKFIK